jgi:hypothetical protein
LKFSNLFFSATFFAITSNDVRTNWGITGNLEIRTSSSYALDLLECSSIWKRRKTDRERGVFRKNKLNGFGLLGHDDILAFSSTPAG